MPHRASDSRHEHDTAPSLRPRTDGSAHERRGALLTFLFTDIEGSTRRWEAEPEAMAPALARHDDVLRAAVEAHGGHVFKTVGDAIFAVFEDSRGAVCASLDAQRALGAVDWSAFGAGFAPLRVRIAVHAGTTQHRDGDYYGPTLNRIARLLAAGHGEQVLCSEAVHALVAVDPPAGVTFRDLGEHRLRDLDRPERVFQVERDGADDAFPPLRTATTVPGNLPLPLSSFVGREDELEALRRLLERHRLVTLTGAGGTGKTRLALQTAHAVRGRFPGGIWWVDLAPVESGELALAAVASALGLREAGGQSLEAVVAAALHDARCLIVLDNCEHLVASVAPLAESLLVAGPLVTLLATSREPLGMAAEARFPLAPLDVRPISDEDSLAVVTQLEAVRLFVERAQSALPSFTVDASNAASVASLCAQLDGLPLAIELAAARVPLLSPAEMLARLDQRFRLLAGRQRGAMPRQQTLHSAIDWSHDLLDPDERILFRRLAVFRGGWSLVAAEDVCADAALPASSVLDVLGRLIEKSMVVADAEDRARRYRFLESLRFFARERLAAAGEADEVTDRLAAWCERLTSEAAVGLEGPEQPAWLDRIATELDNLRAVFDRAVTGPRAAQGLAIAANLGHFWYQRGQPAEGHERLASLLEAAGADAPSVVRSRAFRFLGILGMYQGEQSAAGSQFEAAARELGGADAAERSRILIQHAWQAWATGDMERSRALLADARTALRPGARPWDRALLAMVEAPVADVGGDLEAALRLSLDSLADFEAAGDPFYSALALNNLGWGLILVDRAGEAVETLEQGRALAESLGFAVPAANCLESLGRAAREAGRPDLARESVRAALDLSRRRGIHFPIADCLVHLAILEAEEGRSKDAALALGAAEAAALAFNRSLTHVDPQLRRLQEKLAAAGPIVEASRAEGRALTIFGCIDVGLALSDERSPSESGDERRES